MELLTPGTGLIIWQLIIFVLLFLLLSKLAWKPILSSLKEREKSIQDALDTAENTRAEIARLNATVVEGPPTRLGKLDVDQVVAKWRRSRSTTPP